MRVSFTDKLGSIGGMLGLFSGFSLMAIIELIHWICKVKCVMKEFMKTSLTHAVTSFELLYIKFKIHSCCSIN